MECEMTILTKLTEKDFKKILEHHSIGIYKSHKHIPWALINTVYDFKTTKGRFILKIFEKADIGFIRYQIKIINFLDKKKVPVASILKQKNKKEILIYNKKKIIIQKFLVGKSKEKYNKNTLKDVAKHFGKMSRNLLKLKLANKSNWKINYQFKLIRGFTKNNILNLTKEAKLLLKSLKKLDKKRLRKSLIHGDYHGINILIKDNKLKAIIDFDDSHRDYIAYEIAVFMIDPLITENSFNKRLTKIFFKEYEKQLDIKQEEKKAVYFFVKHRLLSMILWCQEQIKIHPDKKSILTKNIRKFTLKYKSFNKISLEEFLKST